MWNPFRRVSLKPIIPNTDVQPAACSEAVDDAYLKEVESAKMRALLARTQINMIHEQLAANALCNMRGGKCPE